MTPAAILRRLARVLALLMAVVVASETFDVFPCADEAGAAAHAADGASGGADADCLCHLAFVPVVRPAPAVGAPAVTGAAFAPYVARTGRAHRRVPHPPPLG